MPWWKQKRPLNNVLILKHNGQTWANLRYHWWVYLNCSNINKNSGDRYWGKNLKDPKSSRGMISRSCLSTLSRSKRPREISKSLPTTSCVRLYPAPWVLHTSMVNFSQLVGDSTLWFKINFISSLGVSVRTNIPQHMTDCKVCHSLLYISSPTNGMIQFDFRYKNEKECILEPRKSSFLNSTVQVTIWHKDSAVTWLKTCAWGGAVSLTPRATHFPTGPCGGRPQDRTQRRQGRDGTSHCVNRQRIPPAGLWTQQGLLQALKTQTETKTERFHEAQVCVRRNFRNKHHHKPEQCAPCSSRMAH